jgi:hypothetical protein
MKIFIGGNCHSDAAFNLLDPSAFTEGEFEVHAVKALVCAFPDYHCIPFRADFSFENHCCPRYSGSSWTDVDLTGHISASPDFSGTGWWVPSYASRCLLSKIVPNISQSSCVVAVVVQFCCPNQAKTSSSCGVGGVSGA